MSQLLTEAEKYINSQFRTPTVKKYDKIEMQNLLDQTKDFPREELNDFIDHSLVQAKKTKDNIEKLTLLNEQQNEIVQIQEGEKAEMEEEMVLLEQLEEGLNSNLATLKSNIQNLKERAAKLK